MKRTIAEIGVVIDWLLRMYVEIPSEFEVTSNDEGLTYRIRVATLEDVNKLILSVEQTVRKNGAEYIVERFIPYDE